MIIIAEIALTVLIFIQILLTSVKNMSFKYIKIN
jgi:hypothetical protein